MTQSRYINDLLSITNRGHYEAPDLARLLEDAENEDMSAVFLNHLDQFENDIERRFLQTIGLHKALISIVEALPYSDSLTVARMRKRSRKLLKGAVKDFETMIEIFVECDLHGKERDAAIKQIYYWIGDSAHTRWQLAAAMKELPTDSCDPAIITLRTAVLPVLDAIGEDYMLLLELFEDMAPAGVIGPAA